MSLKINLFISLKIRSCFDNVYIFIVKSLPKSLYRSLFLFYGPLFLIYRPLSYFYGPLHILEIFPENFSGNTICIPRIKLQPSVFDLNLRIIYFHHPVIVHFYVIRSNLYLIRSLPSVFRPKFHYSGHFLSYSGQSNL